MKKVISTLFLVTGIAVSSFSQIKIGANLGVNIPANGLSGASVGFGGYLNGRYMVSDAFALGVDLGYFTLGTGSSSASLSVMPILASGEYFFANKGFKPFVGAKVGFVNSSSTVDLGSYGSYSASSLNFAFGPQAGFAYGLTDNLDFNVTLQYLFIASSSSAGILPITAGVTYKFGK